jgi:acyl-CoA thioester hydrolase
VAPVFEQKVSVRWRDTDALGHVNNAVYLTYLEEARDAFYLRVLGDPIYVVVRLEIDFRAEVRHADRIVRVEIAVERVGTTSLTTHETLRTAHDEVAAEARVITVRWDEDARTPIPFSDEQRDRLAEFAASPGLLERQHEPQQPSTRN